MTTIDRRRFLGLGTVVLGSALIGQTLTACSSNGSSSGAPASNLEGQDLIKAAEAEGALLVYYVDQQFHAFSEGFNKLYPSIKISEVVLSPSDARNRIITETVSGAATADVVTTAGSQLSAMVKDNAIRAISVPQDSQYPDIADSQHYQHPYCQYVIIMAYNANLLPVPPATVDELSDPKYKGLITFDNPQNASTACLFLSAQKKQMGQDKWQTWLEGLKANDVQITSGGNDALNNVQTGERAISISSAQSVIALPKGTPVKAGFYPGLVKVLQIMSAPKNGKNPNAAKLFLEFMESKDGQLAVASTGRIPILDMDSPASLSHQVPAGSTFIPADALSDFYANPDPYLTKYNDLWPA